MTEGKIVIDGVDYWVHNKLRCCSDGDIYVWLRPKRKQTGFEGFVTIELRKDSRGKWYVEECKVVE